jgi:DNA-binding NarL/FixJ family response regulator
MFGIICEAALFMSTTINVLLADGRKLVREGLSALLEKHPDIHVVGEADDGEAAGRLIRPLGVHVVVLNLAPPARSGIDVIGAIASAQSGVRLLVLTFAPAAHTVRELLQSGAAGCLARDCAGAELVEAIRTVAAGRTYLSNSLIDAVVNSYAGRHGGTRGGGGSGRAAPKSLAPREREILRAIATGASTKEIAASLKVNAKTIETHRRRLMEKLNLRSVAELTKYAVLQGISPLDVAV